MTVWHDTPLTTTDYDVAVIGGGIGGSALAAQTAAAGLRTVVLEASQTYRDRVRGEWLAPWGVGEARALDLLDVFEAAGAHELPALIGRGGKAQTQESPEGDVPLTFFHPDLQRALAEHARRRGATVLQGARVRGVRELTADRASAIKFELAGARRRITASVVIGADGRNSLARASLGRRQNVHRSARVLAGVRLRDVACDPREGYFLLRDDAGGLASIFPQGDGFARAYVFEQGDTPDAYAGPDGYARFVEVAVASGIPHEVLAPAEPAGPLAAFVADDSWITHPASDHVALIGDAAGVSDPTWGMGIALALRDARTLSAALIELGATCSALHRYAADRDHYYAVIRTAENWHSELLLSTGLEAKERRRRAQRAWRAEPDRFVDFVRVGPEVDVSATARRRFFAEDLVGGDLASAVAASA
jgi:2-polyprenyl-6-methoxyphenol hydroxylase-like FAD-dependent oxidoreductase